MKGIFKMLCKYKDFFLKNIEADFPKKKNVTEKKKKPYKYK